eukprot:3367687-Rhodomonas_salina.4
MDCEAVFRGMCRAACCRVSLCMTDSELTSPSAILVNVLRAVLNRRCRTSPRAVLMPAHAMLPHSCVRVWYLRAPASCSHVLPRPIRIHVIQYLGPIMTLSNALPCSALCCSARMP